MARKRNGLCVLPVVVLEVDLVEMLIDLGWLASSDPSRDELATALSKWVFDTMTRHAQQRWPDA